MKTKFNKYERVAGLFVLTAVFGGLTTLVGTAISQGWFEAKIELETTVENAEGIREGTAVQIAGLHAGAVLAVELRSSKEVTVQFAISKRFAERIHQDSVVHVMRPFIIGEKVLDISQGSVEAPQVVSHATLLSERSVDLMDLASGKTLAPYFDTLGKLGENLRFVAQAFLDPARSKAIVKIFDDLAPLVTNMNGMSIEAKNVLSQVNRKGKLVHVVDNLVTMTDEMNKIMPQLLVDSPELGRNLAHIAKNTAILTDELQKTLPMIQEIGPELPRASRRAMEALDETVVTLKALQKSFLLRGSVKDVREEETNRDRQPASSLPASQDGSAHRAGPAPANAKGGN